MCMKRFELRILSAARILSFSYPMTFWASDPRLLELSCLAIYLMFYGKKVTSYSRTLLGSECLVKVPGAIVWKGSLTLGSELDCWLYSIRFWSSKSSSSEHII
jgi:hypothetical protein